MQNRLMSRAPKSRCTVSMSEPTASPAPSDGVNSSRACCEMAPSAVETFVSYTAIATGRLELLTESTSRLVCPPGNVVAPGDIGLVHHSGSANSGPKRSEEHTSELQSRPHLVCRLLLEK